MVCGFIIDGGTSAVIFVAEVALLGTLEMLEEVVTFQEIEIFDFSSSASSSDDRSRNLW